MVTERYVHNVQHQIEMDPTEAIERDSLRVRAEFRRRDAEIKDELYAPWQPGEMLMLSERKRIAASGLKKIGSFPGPGKRCLEIGYGRLGWLADLISWGVREPDLYGIELDPERAAHANAALPKADLRVGNAATLPWESGYFDLVIVSTVFSSVLGEVVRGSISAEISRVLAPSGAVVIYDIAVNNPRNSNLRRVSRSEVRSLFDGFSCRFQSVTLAPPIARIVAGKSFPLAVILSSVPLLRTHFLAFLVKGPASLAKQ